MIWQIVRSPQHPSDVIKPELSLGEAVNVTDGFS